MDTIDAVSGQVDEFVEVYEEARLSKTQLDLRDFAPDSRHPGYQEIVVELVRVDLEYSWQTGRRTDVAHYQSLFPEVLHAGKPLERVAFEEFRQRRLFGESVSKDHFHDHFAVDTDAWPDLPVGESVNEETTMVCSESVLRELSRVDSERAGRLAAGQRQLPEVGERFLDFQLVGELGRGAFGRVYLARQGDLAERFVALKITPQVSEEPNRLAQLQHTNIVPIYSVHRQGSLQAICMPFLGPNTLADIVKTVEVAQALPNSGRSIVSTIAVRPSSTVLADEIPPIGSAKPQAEPPSVERLPEAETIRRLSHMSYLDAAVWIMTRVADGLAFAHEHGVIHRDLKPGNILLTDDGEPLILDFNLAVRCSPVEQAVAIVGGTLPYSSPEQMVALRKGGSVGPSSDIYSFGVLLFQLLTGHLPHPVHTGSFDDVVARMLADRQAAAPSPRSSNPAVSPGLASIVCRCLAHDPRDRYENTRNLHEDLQRHLEHRPLRYVPNRSLVERTQKWSRRHPKLTSASSVAIFSLLLLATMVVASASLFSRLQNSRAKAASRQFHERLVDAQSSLNSPFLSTRRLEPAVENAEEVAATWGIAEPRGLEINPMFKRLSADGQQQLRDDAVELLYLLCTGKVQMGMRAPETSERTRLLKEALHLNEAAKHLAGSRELPNAFALQRCAIIATDRSRGRSRTTVGLVGITLQRPARSTVACIRIGTTAEIQGSRGDSPTAIEPVATRSGLVVQSGQRAAELTSARGSSQEFFNRHCDEPRLPSGARASRNRPFGCQGLPRCKRRF